jgi:hypothetical protein
MGTGTSSGLEALTRTRTGNNPNPVGNGSVPYLLTRGAEGLYGRRVEIQPHVGFGFTTFLFLLLA